jgi:hypothetical protein
MTVMGVRKHRVTSPTLHHIDVALDVPENLLQADRQQSSTWFPTRRERFSMAGSRGQNSEGKLEQRRVQRDG